jgi:branched-chain amino acid transport system permease protein
MLERLLPELVNGIVLGAFFAIVAIGLSLIMNLTGTINMAHGSFMTLAGYLAFTLVSRGTNFWYALVIAALLTMVVGILTERLLVSPLYKRLPIYSLLLTFGLSLIAEETYRLIWGPSAVPFQPPTYLLGATTVFGAPLPSYRLVIAVALLVVMAALVVFLYRSRLGLRLRAAVQDSEMLAALGINTQLLYMANFAIGILLAGVAGVFAAGLLGLNPNMGNNLLMPAFITVVIGGMGSLTGSIVGGLLIGVAVSVATLYVPVASELVMYLMMAVVLLIRPRGLFGEEGLFG